MSGAAPPEQLVLGPAARGDANPPYAGDMTRPHPIAAAGGCLLLLAGGFFLLALFMFLDPLEGESRLASLVPGLFFGTVVGLPGLALTVWHRRRRADDDAHARFEGLVRSRDSFTVDELTQALGGRAADVAERLDTLAAGDDFDLVFHQPDRRWAHRGKIRVAHSIVQQCGACGAAVGSQVVYADEVVRCPYCQSPLRAALAGPRVGIPPARPEDLPDHLKKT